MKAKLPVVLVAMLLVTLGAAIAQELPEVGDGFVRGPEARLNAVWAVFGPERAPAAITIPEPPTGPVAPIGGSGGTETTAVPVSGGNVAPVGGAVGVNGSAQSRVAQLESRVRAARHALDR
jgi:hypothetical protein